VDGRAVTYGELEAAAAAVAGALAAREAGRGARIGLCAARSLGAFAGYLGILRAGATVVPLGPGQPEARGLAIAGQAGIRLVLVDAGGRARAGALAGAGVEVLDVDAVTAGSGPEWSEAGVVPDDVAYVLFTSGSTGRPKGVPITHANAGAYVRNAIDRYELGPGARQSHAFELTFDSSVHDLFGAWGSGATLVVPPRKALLDPVRCVRDRGITHWASVPSVISLARAHGLLRPGAMRGLACSVFMGEPLLLDDAAAWREAAPGGALHNAYGPTEMTINCTAFRLPDVPGSWPRTSNDTVPIGQADPGVEALVLDTAGRPAACGELCLRGIQRFAGYLDPRDDAGRFLERDGALWYRTGDRVQLEAGQLVHLGRIDRQIKLHGYRIEPGEIEVALRRHPRVREAAVVAGDGGLRAVYTGDRIDDAELARHVRARVPDYMVPGGFTWVAGLPLTANGKVDYRRLEEQCR